MWGLGRGDWNGGTGGTVAFEKAPQNFYEKGIWVEFVQFDLLTNMSDPFPEKIVRERLPMGSAFYGERLRDIVCYVMVGYLVGVRIASNFHW